ncbi:hypothetical protein R4282_06650 [Rhodococcus oxybenzonivorans]|uniref:hypothetical protein n=1 Tax=Rhodococcus oxybenzonivorans TaxID=1990687 RepID=UPI00295522B7|nr:hypothetical protein [Rhodococcus oxybenzonivorans]MDV7352697.1 hypothetical protein [Rhodococcus oxybenzonivorans]
MAGNGTRRKVIKAQAAKSGGGPRVVAGRGHRLSASVYSAVESRGAEVAGGFAEYVTRNAPRQEWALIAKLILDEAFADPVGTRVGDLAGAAAERRQSLLEQVATLKAGEAGRVLAPRAGESRTLVKKLRDDGVLLGLPLGRRPDYHYPAFQFDTVRHRVWPIVAYANSRLGAAEDPWGVTSWWRTPSDILDGRTPLQELEDGDLTEIAVDNMISAAERGV